MMDNIKLLRVMNNASFNNKYISMQNNLNIKHPPFLAWPIIFLALAIIGFYYVKWVPYYAKAFVAYNQHSIGDSIIFGKSAVAPARQ